MSIDGKVVLVTGAGQGIDLEKAKALPPLPGKPAPHQSRPASTYTGGTREEVAPASARAAAGRLTT